MPNFGNLFGNQTVQGLVMIVLIFAVFYFLIIRPQQTAEKKRKKMIEELKVGDKVLTHAGIYGTIAQTKEKDIIVLRIADNTKVEFSKTAISRKVEETAQG